MEYDEERLVGEIFSAAIMKLIEARVGAIPAMRIMGYVMVAIAESVDLVGIEERETGGL